MRGRGPSARELRRQMQRAARLAQTRKRRIPKPHGEKPLIVGAYLTFEPLQAIIDQIEQDGTLTCDARGTPIFRDSTDGNWWETAPALAGIIDYLQMYETRHGVDLPIKPLWDLHQRIRYCMPVDEPLLARLRRDLPALQRVIATGNPDDTADLFRQVQIKIEMERVNGADQTADQPVAG